MLVFILVNELSRYLGEGGKPADLSVIELMKMEAAVIDKFLEYVQAVNRNDDISKMLDEFEDSING